MNKLQRYNVLAMAMGNGYTDTSGGVSITHKHSDLDYVKWKHDLICKEASDIKYIDNNGYGAYTFRIKGSRFIKAMRPYLIREEYITPKTLSKIGDLGLSIIYMDYGSFYPKKRNGKIHAYELVLSLCFKSKLKALSIIKYFIEKYGIRFTIKKDRNRFSLRCGTAVAKNFIEIVKPYVSQVPSMMYKIGLPRLIHQEGVGIQGKT